MLWIFHVKVVLYYIISWLIIFIWRFCWFMLYMVNSYDYWHFILLNCDYFYKRILYYIIMWLLHVKVRCHVNMFYSCFVVVKSSEVRAILCKCAFFMIWWWSLGSAYTLLNLTLKSLYKYATFIINYKTNINYGVCEVQKV